MPKLLLADDSVTIQRVIELTFSGEDIQVIAVSDGEEAIARIPAERPDIVLADIGMPKRTGYDVAAFVKTHAELSRIPVLLLAGAFEPVDQSRAEQVRCDGVLVKPFEPQQVIARVRELLEGAKGTPIPATAGVPRPVERLSRESGLAARDSGPTRESAPEPIVTRASAVHDAAPRVIESPPYVEIPEARPSSEASGSLDEYFDRLDAAFASLGNGPGGAPVPSPVLDEIAAQVDVPTIDELLGGVSADAEPDMESDRNRTPNHPVEETAAPVGHDTHAAPRSASDVASSPAPPSAAPSTGNVIADVFSALLAAEQGEPGTLRVSAGAGPRVAVTDDLVDEVTRRVLERLAPAAAHDMVARIVSEVAERLVREEIARIREKNA